MHHDWEHVKEVKSEVTLQLAAALNNLPLPLTKVLAQRGIDTFDKARSFFRPTLSQLHNPFEMKDMDKAVQRIDLAIKNEQNILVYGDYDVDGVTSVSMMYTFLTRQYDKVSYYIPDRYNEGYGISFKGIDHAEAQEIPLIIALDCGIKANDKIDYANKKGIDFIICDHHQPGETLPNAVAVLDPKRLDCGYPYKELSGCGVGFKLIQAYAETHAIAFEEIAELLDFLAISIAADIVPITGENRVLTHFGLKQINTQPRQGLQSMIALTGLKQELNVADLVFKIAPRINAAGRLHAATEAVRVLIECEEEEAEKISNFINDQNQKRRDLDGEITRQALEMVAADTTASKKRTTVLHHPEWHKGVIGIVASRIIETHYKPTIIFTSSNGKMTGSARSVRGFDVYEAICACDEYIEQYGGHKYAAGLTIVPEHFDSFAKKFEEEVSKRIKAEMLHPMLEIDTELALQQIDPKFFRILQQLAPFGPGNPNPVFVTKGVLASEQRVLGEKHLKLKVFDPQFSSKHFDAIGFGLAKYDEEIAEGIPFDLAYTLEVNEWRGRSTLQLNVKDIHV
jgi:single-stranded-DNA-specific exonuclease